jgi:hypothetical protein
MDAGGQRRDQPTRGLRLRPRGAPAEPMEIATPASLPFSRRAACAADTHTAVALLILRHCPSSSPELVWTRPRSGRKEVP